MQLTARRRGEINSETSPLARLRRDLGYRLRRLIKPNEHTYKIEWIYGYDVAAEAAKAAAAA